MATRGTLLVNPATGAISAPVTASTFRDANGLEIGSDIQAWSANLDSAATHISWSGSNATFASEIVATSSITTTTGNLIVTVGDVITGGGVFATGNISGAQLRLANAGTGAFNASIVHNGTLTAAKTLTLNVSDGNRTLQMGGDLFLGANFTTTNQGALTLTVSGATNVTLPTTGTLSTLAGTEELSGKTLTAPKFADLGFIADANGNELIVMDTTASAVNEITVANAATGGMPSISATGGDTNISLRLIPKGTGSVQIPDGTSSIPALRGSDADSGISFEPGGSKGLYFIVDGAVMAAYFGNGQVSLQGTEGHLVTGSSRLDPAEPAIFRSGASTTGFYFDSTAGEPGLCFSGTYGLKIGSGGNVILQKTITAGGTTGVQVINKTTGSINIEATATSKAVTNSLVTANSIIIAVAATNDSAAAVKNVVAGSGTFTINLTAAANAEMRVNWIVTN